MSSLFRFVQRYPVFKFLPIQIFGILVGTHFNFPLIPLYLLFGISFLFLLSRYFQITLPIIVFLMSILVLQNVELAGNSNLTTGEVLIKAKVEDIQKKRNSDYIILDAGEKHILLQMTDTLAILPGDTLIIRGKLKMPPSPRNPGQFDYGAYLRSQNISAVVDREFSILEIIEGNTGLQRWLFTMRRGIHERLTEAVGFPYAGLASGLLLGDKSGIEPEMKEQFRRLGIIHILAVSGLHVGFVLLVLTVLAKIAMLPRLYRFLFITGGLLFYLGISGGAISVMRAVTMAILYTYGNFREKKYYPGALWDLLHLFFCLLIHHNCTA